MATTTSPINGLPVPDDNSPNDPPIHIGALVNQLDTRLVARFANAADRSAKITAPVEGMITYLESDNRFYRHDGSGWQYAGGAPPPIVACTAGSGWSLGVRPPGVYKDASGLCHLVGAVAPNSTYNPQDGGTHTAMQLPAGFYPASNTTAVAFIPTPAMPQVLVYIQTTGIVSVIGGTVSSIGSATGHYLDGITYHPAYANAVPLA